MGPRPFNILCVLVCDKLYVRKTEYLTDENRELRCLNVFLQYLKMVNGYYGLFKWSSVACTINYDGK